MQTLLTVLAVTIAVAIIVLHLLSVMLADKRSIILNFVNVSLHIALVFVLLFKEAALELLALAFMSSLLIYTLAFEICRRVRNRRSDR